LIVLSQDRSENEELYRFKYRLLVPSETFQQARTVDGILRFSATSPNRAHPIPTVDVSVSVSCRPIPALLVLKPPSTESQSMDSDLQPFNKETKVACSVGKQLKTEVLVFDEGRRLCQCQHLKPKEFLVSFKHNALLALEPGPQLDLSSVTGSSFAFSCSIPSLCQEPSLSVDLSLTANKQVLDEKTLKIQVEHGPPSQWSLVLTDPAPCCGVDVGTLIQVFCLDNFGNFVKLPQGMSLPHLVLLASNDDPVPEAEQLSEWKVRYPSAFSLFVSFAVFLSES
jgi:hypothetical protein